MAAESAAKVVMAFGALTCTVGASGGPAVIIAVGIAVGLAAGIFYAFKKNANYKKQV